MLDIVFALDSGPNVVEDFEINEAFQTMLLRETVYGSRAVLVYASNKVAGDTDIENAVGLAGQKVDIATCHYEILIDVDGRDKPGHDEAK